ncbi:hypothetical protein 2 [Shahe tombus-like virus 1]|uniref:hypothetical protein 2 n=1 Tax=Shahe tombus-like virus 1 TaxID=1923455 RepID=UPI000909839C|nr:hypothetical protein 2 [Shahe tombus-like virus 1]APG76370.1 hypothetical protein 2 [Shahe tombus-like virus 1]
MARRKVMPSPVQGGVRRRRNKQPNVTQTSGTSSVIKYSALGSTVTSDVNGEAWYHRMYIPGSFGGLTQTVGTAIVGYYSTAKFQAGTTLRWEPSVSFSTSGRVYVGFTDNPEMIEAMRVLTGGNAVNAVKGLGDVISFPVWQETDIPFSPRMRRKMFDTNQAAITGVDVLDRTCQTAMFLAIDGMPASTRAGSVWFHDNVAVEGMSSIET